MVGITNLIFALVLTSLTGSIVLIVWNVFRCVFEGTDCFYMIYHGLHFALLTFVVPISFLWLWIIVRELETGGIRTGYFEATRSMNDFMMIIGIAWFVGAVITTSIHGFRAFQLRRLKRYGIKADEPLQELLQKCKISLNVKEKVSLYVADGLTTSFMCGCIRPEIWLPLGQTDQDYEMMLIHELVHIKSKDGLFLMVGTIAAILHWFNLSVYFLKRQMKRWDELKVDYISSKYVKDTKEYACLLYRLSQENGRSCFIGKNVRTFAGKQNLVKERISRMSKYNQLKKRRKSIVAFFSVMFLAVSAFFTGSTTTIVAEAKEQWYMETMEADYVETVQAQNLLEEFVITEEELSGYTFVEDEENTSLRATTQNVSWTVGTESVRLSGAFTASAGGRVSIFMGVEPSDLTVRMGLKQPDGTYVLVRGRDLITHTFTLTQSGTYRFVVLNDSDVEVLTVTGSYAY